MTDNGVPEVETANVQVAVTQVQVNLAPNGRPSVIAVPTDITDFEIASYIRAVLDVTDRLRAARVESSLVIARALPGRPT